jgi:hypothetical protein
LFEAGGLLWNRIFVFVIAMNHSIFIVHCGPLCADNWRVLDDVFWVMSERIEQLFGEWRRFERKKQQF